MSLSRAFAYAGCPNIITSLWKAEDRTTAYLTQQLHYYLEKYKSKEIICYCASGSRSVNAGLKLKKAGFTVGNLRGGIASWNF